MPEVRSEGLLDDFSEGARHNGFFRASFSVSKDLPPNTRLNSRRTRAGVLSERRVQQILQREGVSSRGSTSSYWMSECGIRNQLLARGGGDYELLNLADIEVQAPSCPHNTKQETEQDFCRPVGKRP